MFTDEFDVIFLGLGINTLALAHECASQNRSVIIIYDDEDKLSDIQYPYYIWDSYLDSRSFLKSARKNKISEFTWRGHEKSFKFEINNCWKLNSPKIIPLIKKELKNFNVPIMKGANIELEIDKKVQVKTDRDKFNAEFCVVDINLFKKLKTNLDLNIQSSQIALNQVNLTIENVKGFPISTNDINIDNVIIETPGYQPKYETKIISNLTFPIHESEVIITLNWINENTGFDKSKFLYLNDIWMKNWKRKRNNTLLSCDPLDIPITFYNISDTFLNNKKIMLINAHHDPLNHNFLGHDISKSFKLAEIFSNWLNASIKQENFDWSSSIFYRLNPQDASLSYDLYKNADFRAKFMNFISSLEGQKVDEFISAFRKKLSHEKFMTFLKGKLPNSLIDKFSNDLTS